MSPAPASHQTVQWVALPTGVDGGTARVAVFVAPRLIVDGDEQQLSVFEDWTDWPARLAATSFYVEFDDGTAAAANRVTVTADSVVWRALFPATTPLRSFQALSPRGTPFVSYSVAAVDDVLRRAYVRAAGASVDRLPPTRRAAGETARAAGPSLEDCFDDLAGLFREPAYRELLSADDAVVARDLAGRASVARTARAAAATPVTLLPPARGTADHLAAAVAFHRRPAGGAEFRRAAAEPAGLDFHQLLTSFGDHPALLRLLGLVCDIELPAAALRSAGRLRLRPLWTPPEAEDDPSRHDDLVPWTRYQMDGATFTAASPLGPPGLVDLPTNGFQVSQVDLDGAVQKTLAMVAGLVAGRTDGAAPPAVRSGGISLVRPDRVSRLHEELAVLDAGADELTATELTRGYRLDVWDGGRWHSLHRREVSYTVAGGPPLPATSDEGFLQDSVTLSDPDGAIAYLHESVATWDGWSLAATRPERSLSTAPDAVPTRPENTPLTSTNLRVDSVVTPGSLPRLRFGREYRLRLRTVDLAGNGLSLAAADAVGADTATPPLTYRRFEPVPAPEIVPLTSYVEGADQARMVVRGTTVSQPPLDPALTPPDVRELVPPKASLRMVELHGRLDAALGGSPAERAEVYRIASRESGTLAGGLVDGELPYLPDPLCAGVVFFDLPGRESPDPLVVDFEYPTWHQPRPVRLRLLPFPSGSNPEPEWDADERLLTVWLRPAKVWTIRIASKIADPALLAVPHWGRDTAGDEEHATLMASVEAGRNAVLGPQREITLVHAVPQPANWLDMAGFDAHRGETPSIRISGSVTVDTDSTQRVDLTATWSEWVDDGVREPWRRTTNTVVASTQIPPARPTWGYLPLVATPFVPPGTTFSVGDTRHRDVTFQVVATGRYRDHFPASYADQPDAFTTSGDPVDETFRNAVPPPPPVVLDVVPLLDRHEVPGGSERAGGWLRVYLARPWYLTGDGELLGVIAVDPQPRGPEDPRYDLVSLCGQDETRFSANVPSLTPDRLTDGVDRIDDLRLTEPTAGSDPVSVVGYQPEFDPATDRWFCDVHVDLGAAYFPFVRLAVVRWQPRSPRQSPADTLMVSPVVLLDIVQTVPGRTLTAVRRPDGQLDISLRGPTYIAVADQSDPEFRPEGRATVTAQVQRRDPSIADDLLAWSNIGDPVALPHTADSLTETWRATIRPPAVSPGERLRLLITEEDHIAADPPTPGYTGRTVYADILNL